MEGNPASQIPDTGGSCCSFKLLWFMNPPREPSEQPRISSGIKVCAAERNAHGFRVNRQQPKTAAVFIIQTEAVSARKCRAAE